MYGAVGARLRRLPAALAIWVGATALLGDAGLLDKVVPAEDGIVLASYSGGESVLTADDEAAAYLESDGDGEAPGGLLLGSARSAGSDAPKAQPVSSSLRTKTVTGQILCASFDTDLANLDDLVSEVDGYYETEMDSEIDGVPNAQRTIRVPMEELDAFLGGLSAVGKPTNLVKTEEDLTQQYAEINARLTTLTAQRDQYNQLIAQAASAEEIETLAANAESVQAQIDALEEAIRAWGHRVRIRHGYPFARHASGCACRFGRRRRRGPGRAHGNGVFPNVGFLAGYVGLPGLPRASAFRHCHCGNRHSARAQIQKNP